MTGDQANSLRSQAAGEPVGQTASSAGKAVRRWSNLWQVPTLIVSTGLILAGLFSTIQPPAHDDFAGALAQVHQLVSEGQYERAEAQLRTVIEPSIRRAAGPEQAQFHALAGDCLSLGAQQAGAAVSERVIEQYARSIELGLPLTPARLERSAEAFLHLGQTQNASNCLVAMEAILSTNPDSVDAASYDLRAGRNRVFRKLVEHALKQPDLSYDQVMQKLSNYRKDPSLGPADEVWAVAKQAELRLESGYAAQAVDALLVEMRRLEGLPAARDSVNFGELYTLLGRGYFELGDSERAKAHLQHALTLFTDARPIKGEAMLLLGELAQAGGQLDEALEFFELVIRDFPGTTSHLPAMLGRAEVNSLLSEHQASQADYRRIAEALEKSGSNQSLAASRVAESLCDRHDAALALGKIDLALEYAALAEPLFDPQNVPEPVIVRLASSSRQVADDLVARSADGDPLVDPSIRREANARFESAGRWYLRHADVLTADSSGSDWTASLWAAADSFDLGGRQDLALEQWNRYLDSQPIDDSRRAETLFRIAQAHHARTEFEQAAAFYQKVIDEYARSAFAAQSFVPGARCLLQLGQVDQARQLLTDVLSGDRLLTPDARDYRDALLELARVHHSEGQFVSAIQRFTEAVDRYPDDARLVETLFMLADSLRCNALDLQRQLDEMPSASSVEAGRLASLRTEQLQRAQELFARVADQPADAAPVRAGAELARRAQLYRADCAFYLGNHEQAINLYDQAARQFSTHHSSMYALIQIVNCYGAMGDHQRMQAAHHRALVRLKQLPEGVFSAADSLMDRAAWERWLENSPAGTALSAVMDPPAG